jgi:hypothetical protein
MAEPHEQFDADAEHIVLFGMPDAGKSSLLGALAQVAQTQERALGGRLTDVTHGLGDLQHRLYDGRPQETLEEIVPYPVAFDPLDGTKPDPTRRDDAVLVDCDGRAANNILTSRRGLAADPPSNSLAAEILSADALLLVVDAGATPAQVDNDLAEFVRFLRMFRRDRGRRSEVGGLPVFLVLSKCDLLAKPTDTSVEWQASVDARKLEVGRRFKEFLEDDSDDDRLPFGAIELELAATAVKWPALADAPARPREPWGVAELFHRALVAAGAFQTHRAGAQRRLVWTVGGAATFFAALLGLAGGMVLLRQSAPSLELSNKVESYRAREGLTASTRLTEPLQRKFSELSELAADPEFAKLPSEERKYLTGRLKELEQYINFTDRLQRVRPPADARSEDDLRETERLLQSDLALPADYQTEWRQTEAAVLRDKWLDDIKAIRKATADVEAWYRERIIEGNGLLLFTDRTADNAPLPWTAWTERVGDLLRRSSQPPFRPADRLRDSKSVRLARAVTYDTVLRLPAVEQARSQWERLRQRLERLRDVAQALGLAGDGSRAVLKIGSAATAASAAETLQNLKQLYPTWPEWSLNDLPDPAASEVRQAAHTAYTHLIQAGRDVVRRKFLQGAPDGQESWARWQPVAEWLPVAPELRDWRELANVLRRLADPSTPDPVAALADFLRRSEFRIELSSLRLTVPYDIRGLSVRPVDRLTIYVQTGDKVAKLPLRLDGEGARDPRRRVTTYTFSADGLGTLPYRPGDVVWADVPLRDATGREHTFSWWAVPIRSTVYQIERLAVSPRLHATGQKIENGEVADGVTLTPVPESGLPRVPDLLPSPR